MFRAAGQPFFFVTIFQKSGRLVWLLRKKAAWKIEFHELSVGTLLHSQEDDVTLSIMIYL
ncbi:MAG: hypothetical protein D6820_17380 [Lentisphaerae bacterium]|nr:MAG: hypothetical protein D6820_17380 [Lentisphaerota bacterium]